MSYRLLFLDLDGTLVGPRDIVSPRNQEALKAANRKGCTIVICTARTQYMVVKIASQWHGHGYGIFVNGAVISEWETGLVLNKISLTPPIVSTAVQAARDHDLNLLAFGVDVERDQGRVVYADNEVPLHPSWQARHKDRVRTVENFAGDHGLAPVSFAVYGQKEAVEQTSRRWRNELDGLDVFCAYDPPYNGWCAYANSSSANKAAAAQHVARMLNVPHEQTMAIGDHVNDVALLRWAALGVCMESGHLEAKAVADHITAPQHDDGVAQAIERFVLGKGI